MDEKKIKRINELAHKQKAGTLTPAEKAEQAVLRKEYIEAYKRSLISQLENLTILEPDGTVKKPRPKN
jgi:UPF0291 protein LMOf2365_1322